VADAEAVCEAVSRPNMRFVPIKSIEQQAILSVHREGDQIDAYNTVLHEIILAQYPDTPRRTPVEIST
jgi:hypothetical protein